MNKTIYILFPVVVTIIIIVFTIYIPKILLGIIIGTILGYWFKDKKFLVRIK